MVDLRHYALIGDMQTAALVGRDASIEPIPVEVAVFTDAGVAWNPGENPGIFGGDRHGVWSADAALRVNLFKYAVGEFDFVHPSKGQVRAGCSNSI